MPAPVASSAPVVALPAPAGGVAGAGATGAAAAGAPSASGAPAGPASAPAASAAGADATARPGAEGALQPWQYVVKAGDTLVRIGLETGQNWRDIARWNQIDNPNVLEVGAVLRVSPPPSEVNAATTRPVAPVPRLESRPLDARPGAPGTMPASPTSSAPPGAPTSSAGPSTGAGPAPSLPPVTPAAPAPAATGTQGATGPATASPAPPASRDGDTEVSWGWPASGPVTTAFDDVRSKGLVIAGKAGDPVLAAADGRVVYAGSGLRGYGNLVIVKHNATFLTAYAHNQSLLVKEDQIVRRGQKIAEMGSSDTDRVQLHFEVRRLGKPVDPAKVLPAR